MSIAKTTERKKMTQDELKAVLAAEIAGSTGGLDSEIGDERQMNLNYYYGRKFGNEIPGQSEVVLADVAETVDWIMPSVMRAFMGGRRPVRFVPQNADDVPWAEQSNEYAIHTFTKKNNGFRILHDWAKDALIEKVGTVRYGWETVICRYVRHYTGLSQEELAFLLDKESSPDIKVLGHEERIEKQAMLNPENGQIVEIEHTVHDVDVCISKKKGEFRIYNVPPSDILVSKRATADLDTIPFIAVRDKRSISQLEALGIPKKILDEIPGDADNTWDEADDDRYYNEDSGSDQSVDRKDSSRRLKVLECYLLIDADGDGEEERRRILCCGDAPNLTILEDVEVEEVGLATMCPIPMPHRFFGRSEADLVTDLQFIRSTILRQILQNLYQANHPRLGVLVGEVNTDDLLTARIGGFVRMSRPDAVTPFPTTPLGPMAFNTLEYLHGVRENRTGITRYNQGTDAESLNQTATGIRSIMGASQVRIDLILRLFGEGMKRLFRSMLRAFVEHADELKNEMIELRGEFVQIEPQKWNPDMDVTIEVGIGAGDAESRLMQSQQLAAMQEKIVAGGGMGTLVTAKNIFNLTELVTAEMGFKAKNQFFTDPESEEAKAAAQAQAQNPPPNPAMILAEAQAKQIAQEMEIALKKFQLEEFKTQQEIQIKTEELKMKGMEIGLEKRLEGQTEERRAGQNQQEMQAKLQLEAVRIAQEGELERERLRQEYLLRMAQIESQAEVAKQKAQAAPAAKKEKG